MHKKITHTFLYPLFVVVCLGSSLFPSMVIATALKDVQVLADSGLSGLSLRMLDKHQPLAERDVVKWSEWETLRYNIYLQQKNFQELTKRYGIIPAGSPNSFRAWSAGHVAQAWIAMGDGIQARKVLSEIMWDSGADITERLPEWSELIVRSYLVDDMAADAATAALKLKHLYGKSIKDADELYVRALLLAGRHEDAARYLTNPEVEISSTLKLWVELGVNKVPVKKILSSARRIAKKKRIAPRRRLEALIIAAEAAHKAEHYSSQILLLEKAVAMRADVLMTDRVFTITPDALWNAYHAYAEYLGNKSKLLVGEDAKWFEKAVKLSAKNKAKARALFAFLANKGASPDIRLAAHQQFATMTAGVKNRYELLVQLYLNSSWYFSEKEMPSPIRRVLADEALKRSDIKFASRMLSGLENNNGNAKDVFSNIREARIHVMAGHYQKGVELIDAALLLGELKHKKDIDKLVQVIFDLQSLGQHELAFELFDKVLLQLDDIQHKREILFWMADSQKEIGNPEEAARLYLKSALLDNPKARDPWADSARYHAAGALAEAGLKADARKIYRDMLKYTKDLGRRKVLQREMRQLQIK